MVGAESASKAGDPRSDVCDVAIVGGGAIGLYLGCLLSQSGSAVRVLERRLGTSTHSRAIGIHPPGLACLAQIGVADTLIAQGARVRRALAFGAQAELGSVSFDAVPYQHSFVLCIPQSETERTLEARLATLDPSALRRGHALAHCQSDLSGALLQVESEGQAYRLRARFLVGCDGPRSAVREALAIRMRGASYAAHFAMIDVDDDTPFGTDAAVFLSAMGLVESFPLPWGRRRWVVGLAEELRAEEPCAVAAIVAARTGLTARADTASMVSAFTAEHYLADRFCAPSAALAGDAAHVLSPIGGQGMNLGFLDASLLAVTLQQALAQPARSQRLLAHYSRTRRAAAKAATRRAELYMGLARAQRFSAIRDRVLARALAWQGAGSLASLFAMGGLGSASSS